MGVFDNGRKMVASPVLYGETVRYVPLTGTPIDCLAKVGEQAARVTGYEGANALERHTDYIIRASELAGIVPRLQDAIIDAQGVRHIVSAPAGEPCWRWHDRTRTAMRIHTEEACQEH